jgi:hypothetical protein
MLVSTPVSPIARAFVLVVALTAPAVAVSAQSNRANQTQLRWYDAYNQGVRAVQNRDWAAAERLLLQAQASGTKPGPRVYAYGDSYLRFFPDYYLGIVYLNTGREREAETAFGRVRAQNLIGAKDPEYAALQRQSGEATFNRAMKEAVELNAKGDFTAARNRAEEARLTNVDNGKATKLLQDITVQMAKVAQPPPPTTTPAPVQPTYTQTPSTNVANQPPVSAGNTPNASLPNQGVIRPPATTARIPPKTPNQTFDRQPPVLPPSTATLRNGLLAYFSGDYRSAIPLLTSAADQPGASPRAELFLACAKVGLALTGGGDAALLREARTAFQSANLQDTLSAADRRLISPRVLQQLEAQ